MALATAIILRVLRCILKVPVKSFLGRCHHIAHWTSEATNDGILPGSTDVFGVRSLTWRKFVAEVTVVAMLGQHPVPDLLLSRIELA